ncbi:MAG TPA: ComEC/Rec2 family competence protein [Candidatus Limnocylindrales bacterium]|nr:ComEC/Rec2 family competence protein [Candidatus Limnocylindrales bacterium]
MGRAVAVAIGAVAGAALLLPGRIPLAVWPALLAVLVAAITAPRDRAQYAPAVAVALPALLGVVVIALRVAAGPQPAATVALPEGRGPWRGVVETISAPRGGQQSATLRLDAADIRVAATLPRFPAIEPGDAVLVSGRIDPPSDDDYGAYLARIGVSGTIRSRTLDQQPRPEGAWDVERLRRGAADALSRAIPEPEAGLAAGILIGLRDRVDRDLAAAFTTAGASHVVAISGWNIAIVAASVAALAGRLNRRRRAVLTIVAIVVYVAFVGATASVLRAAAMAAVVLLARETGRAGRAVAGLAWAAVVILVIDPNLVRDAGFQLSSLATAGLLVWATPLSARIEALGRGRLPGWLVEGLGVSLAAQAATLPIVLGAFGRLSLVSPAVNLLVVPFVAPAMAAGGVALLAGAAVVFGAPPIVATAAGLPAWVLLGWIVGVVRAGAALPLASVTLDPPVNVVAAAMCAVVLLIIATPALRSIARQLLGHESQPGAPRQQGLPNARVATGRTPRHPTERFAIAALGAAVVATAIVFVHRPDGRTRITVLDVGQGDAILVEGSRGGRLLVDGGPDPDRLAVALDERLPPWDRRIDALVLTHPHEDHVAGLALLLGRYRVGHVFEPGMRGPGPGYAAWAARLAAGGTSSALLATGDSLSVDDADLAVLWPDPGGVPREPTETGTGINNVSIVLLGQVAGRRFLLAGDIEEGIDPTLAARGLPHVDFLKVAHHGSRTSSTNPFLDLVSPSVAVVSAGAGNPYGHPAPATLARLADHGAKVLRTDRDGSVQVTLDADRVTVMTTGPRKATAILATAVPGKRSTAAAFACGIAVAGTASVVARARSVGGPPAVRRTAARPGRRTSLLYHRPDVGPRTRGRRRAAPVPRPTVVAHDAFVRRGGGRGVAREPHRGGGDRGRSTPRRSGRAPPRRRQDSPR